MPKVPIQIQSGWSQESTERAGGQPRISRLVNCQIGSAGEIVPTPGEALVPMLRQDSVTLERARAFGRSNGTGWVMFEGKDQIDYVAFGLQAASRCGGVWRPHPEHDERFGYFEAPRARLVFSDERAHYYFPCVVDIGSGQYVVVAERATSVAGAAITATAFAANIEWCFINGNTSMALTDSGSGSSVMNLMPNNCHTWMVAADKYLVLYTAANVVQVLEYDATAAPSTAPSCWVIKATLIVTQATTSGTGKSLDAALSSDSTRLVVAMGDGQVAILNTATWATVYLGAPAFAAITAGTVAVGAAAAGSYVAVYRQAASNNWFISSFNDAGAVGANTAFFTSGAPAPATHLTARPGLTNLSGTSYWAVSIQYLSGVSSCVTATMQVSTAGVVTGQIMLSPVATPISKPRALYGTGTATPSIVTWNGDASGDIGRSLRSAMLMVGRDSTFGPNRYSCQVAQVFRSGDPASLPVIEHQYTVPQQMLFSSYLPPLINGNRRRGWMAAMVTLKEGSTDSPVGTVGTNVWLVTCADASQDAIYPNQADIFATASARGRTIVASGEPRSILPHPELAGFSCPPANPTVTHPAAGGTPTAGTYLYCLVMRNVDSQGGVQWSAVSDPVSITTGTPGSNLVTFANYSPQLGATNASTEVYRTTNGGTVFYRVSEATGTTGTFTDTIADASLITRPVLYTQGERAGVSGLLDHFGPPPCRCICTGPDRMMAGGLSDEKRVQFSNLFFPSESISWPQNPAFFVDVDGYVTAVHCLDSVWLVFSTDGIWAITGQGPDAQGVGAFDEPRRISGFGTASPRSLLEIQSGLCFQAPNGQIYLVQRGGLQIQWISQPIRDAITTDTPAAADTNYYQSSEVVGACYDDEAHQAIFALRDNATSWVYDDQMGSWHLVTTSEPDGYCLGVWITELQDQSGYVGPVWAYQTSAPERRRRINDAFFIRESDEGQKSASFETSDIDIGGGRVRRGFVTITHEHDAFTFFGDQFIPRVTLDWWFDGARRSTSPACTSRINDLLAGDAVSNPTGVLDAEASPSRQKCNQFRVKVTMDNGQIQRWRVTGLAFDIESTGKKLRALTGSWRD